LGYASSTSVRAATASASGSGGCVLRYAGSPAFCCTSTAAAALGRFPRADTAALSSPSAAGGFAAASSSADARRAPDGLTAAPTADTAHLVVAIDGVAHFVAAIGGPNVGLVPGVITAIAAPGGAVIAGARRGAVGGDGSFTGGVI